MADRDDNVYKAKLAEQAERYDGKIFNFSHQNTRFRFMNNCEILFGIELFLIKCCFCALLRMSYVHPS